MKNLSKILKSNPLLLLVFSNLHVDAKMAIHDQAFRSKYFDILGIIIIYSFVFDFARKVMNGRYIINSIWLNLC